jgi:hypothetical protein
MAYNQGMETADQFTFRKPETPIDESKFADYLAGTKQFSGTISGELHKGASFSPPILNCSTVSMRPYLFRVRNPITYKWTVDGEVTYEMNLEPVKGIKIRRNGIMHRQRHRLTISTDVAASPASASNAAAAVNESHARPLLPHDLPHEF